jgi:hypothetical protein
MPREVFPEAILRTSVQASISQEVPSSIRSVRKSH